jgi:hypothetical protein
MRLRRSSVVSSRETRRWASATRSSMLIVASQTRLVPSCEAEATRWPSGDHDTLFDSPGMGADDDDLGAGFAVPDPDHSVA